MYVLDRYLFFCRLCCIAHTPYHCIFFFCRTTKEKREKFQIRRTRMGNDLFLPVGEIEPETKGRCGNECKAFVYVRDNDVYTKRAIETLGDPRLVAELSRDMMTKTPTKNPVTEAYPPTYLQEWGDDTVYRYDVADVSRLYVIGTRYIVFESPNARYKLPNQIPVDFMNIVAVLMQYTNHKGELPACVVCQSAVGTLRMPCQAPDLHRVCIDCNVQMLKRYTTQIKDWRRTGRWFHTASTDETPLPESRHPPSFACPMCRGSAAISLEDMIPAGNRAVMPRDINLLVQDELNETERELQSMLRDDQRECVELRKKRHRPEATPRRPEATPGRPDWELGEPDDLPPFDPGTYLRTQPSDQRLFGVGIAVQGHTVCTECWTRRSFVRYPCGHKIICLECHTRFVRRNNGTMPELRCFRCGGMFRKAFVDNSPRLTIPILNERRM